MYGRATLTMVASSTTISCAVAMTRRARPSRGRVMPATGAPGAVVCPVTGRVWDMRVLLVGLATVVCMPWLSACRTVSHLFRHAGVTAVGDLPRAVVCERRREAVPVAPHRRAGVLAAQRFGLEAIGDGLKVASVSCLACPSERSGSGSRDGNHAELLHLGEDVDDPPHLGDAPAGEAPDEDLLVSDRIAGWREASVFALVGPGNRGTHDDLV